MYCTVKMSQLVSRHVNYVRLVSVVWGSQLVMFVIPAVFFFQLEIQMCKAVRDST